MKLLLLRFPIAVGSSFADRRPLQDFLSMHSMSREVLETLQQGESNLRLAMPRAINAIKSCEWRIYDTITLERVKGIGSTISNIVRHSLWSCYPPERPDEEDEAQNQPAQEQDVWDSQHSLA
jgi:hypothetical protein